MAWLVGKPPLVSAPSSIGRVSDHGTPISLLDAAKGQFPNNAALMNFVQYRYATRHPNNHLGFEIAGGVDLCPNRASLNRLQSILSCFVPDYAATAPEHVIEIVLYLN